jgi:uncharacterized protein with NRDE domain
MCLIGLRREIDGRLIMAANRDEFADRPTAAMSWWTEGILAGRDLRAGGTWLGIHPDGRIAAVTNVRDPSLSPDALPRDSRGEMVVEFLLGEEPPMAFAQRMLSLQSAPAGYNLILGAFTQQGLSECIWLGGRTRQMRPIQPGIAVLSNAELDTPWPKVERLRQAMTHDNAQGLEEAMSCAGHAPDHALPNTGVPVEWERRLSATLITGADYHTRSTTLLTLDARGGDVREITRRPDGSVAQDVRFELRWSRQV